MSGTDDLAGFAGSFEKVAARINAEVFTVDCGIKPFAAEDDSEKFFLDAVAQIYSAQLLAGALSRVADALADVGALRAALPIVDPHGDTGDFGEMDDAGGGVDVDDATGRVGELVDDALGVGFLGEVEQLGTVMKGSHDASSAVRPEPVTPASGSTVGVGFDGSGRRADASASPGPSAESATEADGSEGGRHEWVG